MEPFFKTTKKEGCFDTNFNQQKMKITRKLLGIFLALLVFSCSKEETSEESEGLFGADAIVGQWFLTTINETDVSNLDCYQESYIRSDGQTIDFYLVDLLEDGSCELVLNSTEELTIQDDFYYVGDEAIEIYIEGRSLTWRVNFDTTLIFEKN